MTENINENEADASDSQADKYINGNGASIDSITPMPDNAISNKNISNKNTFIDISSLIYKNTNASSPYIEVRFKGGRKDLFLNKKNFQLQKSDIVIVSAGENTDAGEIVSCGNCAKDRLREQYKIEQVKNEVIRLANNYDKERYKKNCVNELAVVEKAREYAKKYKLDMKITDAEWQFDCQRLTVFFTAPQRIDFREMVKGLARDFKTRIELRQISTREETKRIGEGFGPCGIGLCCTTFLHGFNHVTLDHARVQQLSNNVSKLSGYCGKLKCCLLYEYDNYASVIEGLPPVGSVIEDGDVCFKIAKIDVYKDMVFIYNSKQSNYDSISFEKLKEYSKSGKVTLPYNSATKVADKEEELIAN